MAKTTEKPLTRLTPQQCAKVYGHCRDFWVKLISAGELKATDERCPGGSIPRWMIDPVDVEAWRESRQSRPVARPSENGPQTRVLKKKGYFARMREERQRKRAAAIVQS